MKTTFTIALLFLVTLLLAQTSEEEAIKNALKGETTSFFNRDYNAWASHWDHNSNVNFLVTSSGMRSNNWEEISQSIKEYMESNPDPGKVTLSNSDFDISINGDQAFAVYVQHLKLADTEIKSYEVRNLRKVSGQWKLVSMITSPLDHD
ncbi:YybH family protein [Pleomorphovibrio marinus]|uniref:YybH family protein n=1 Tax=Pleomorphovibrio marinus TaxID=2164132 RepID=UPI001300873F|nr:nuclear transport factor 2 family protein [Pleomorphovibrio marinus]